MENKKILKVNTALCDVRNITEELLDAYDGIEINAANLIINPAAQTLLARRHASLNCANTLNLEENVLFTCFNGMMTIRPSTVAAEEKTFLVLNGKLDIEPGSETALENYCGIVVNGAVNCPNGIADTLGGKLTVNGAFNTYPDGCIRLKDVAVLDRFFHLRAKQDAFYYAAKRMVALSPDVRFDSLAEKNVRLAAKRLLVSEALAETAVPFFDEQTDIVVLPDGCSYVDDDAVLDEALLKRHGGKLYVAGDLTIHAKAAGLLDQVTFLRVDGDLLVARSLKDRVLAMDVEYDDLYVVGGTVLANAGSDQITAYMLENAEDGLSAVGCAHISIAADVTPELLREKLVSVIACASVSCATKEQSSIVSLLSRDVSSISLSGEEEEDDEDKEDENTVRINAAVYTF